MKTRAQPLLAIMVLALLAGCGGGGSGSVAPTASGGNAGTTATPTPVPTATATFSSSPTISGTAVDYTTGNALVGFSVSVGGVPGNPACSATQSATTNACGVPASPVATATTSATGAFSVPASVGNVYMLTISNGSTTYATLHRTVSLVSSASGGALGIVKITSLSTDEQSWLVDVNALRETVAYPTSYANLAIDEYAEEQARAEANAVAAGVVPYSDATQTIYIGYYDAQPGAMYTATGNAAIEPNPLGFSTTFGSAGSGQATLPATAPGWQASDYGWMYGDKSNCVAPYAWNSSASCPTNHYVNLSNTANVWIGLGESTTGDAAAGGQTVYDLIIPQAE